MKNDPTIFTNAPQISSSWLIQDTESQWTIELGMVEKCRPIGQVLRS